MDRAPPRRRGGRCFVEMGAGHSGSAQQWFNAVFVNTFPTQKTKGCHRPTPGARSLGVLTEGGPRDACAPTRAPHQSPGTRSSGCEIPWLLKTREPVAFSPMRRQKQPLDAFAAVPSCNKKHDVGPDARVVAQHGRFEGMADVGRMGAAVGVCIDQQHARARGSWLALCCEGGLRVPSHPRQRRGMDTWA